VTKGCCDLFLQSSSDPESMFTVLGKAAVHQSWAMAGFYERQTCIGVAVVTQGCCELVLQSSSDPESTFIVLGKAAVHQ